MMHRCIDSGALFPPKGLDALMMRFMKFASPTGVSDPKPPVLAVPQSFQGFWILRAGSRPKKIRNLVGTTWQNIAFPMLLRHADSVRHGNQAKPIFAMLLWQIVPGTTPTCPYTGLPCYHASSPPAPMPHGNSMFYHDAMAPGA